MKRSSLFLSVLTMIVFLGSSSALMQQNKQLQQEAGESVSSAPETQALPQTYINNTSRHKLILSGEDIHVYNNLRSQNAIVSEIDYGSFKLVTVDEDAMGGRAELLALPTAVRDDQDFIPINGYLLDTSDPAATYDRLPAELRRPEGVQLQASGIQTRGGLFIVQFAGPVRDEWLDALKGTGVDIVTYLPMNAYVVRAKRGSAGDLQSLKSNNSFVQFVGGYEPAFRLSPGLQSLRRAPADEPVDITVQVIDGPDAEQAIGALKGLAKEVVLVTQVLNYHNVQLKVSAGRLDEIALLDDVFALEERGQIRRYDEAQGQILAGNLTGNAPSGPGYLTWLAGKGFTSAQFTTFSVNVVDDATSLTGHPDLPTARVAFTNNPTGQTGAQGGHGFLNANIIAGFNSGTGAALEDVLGFNYGLGIAPFARVGSTAIFGAGAATGTTWENTAYGQGARISSNSWGFQTATGAPIARYDVNAQEFDRIVRDAQTGTAGHQQMTIVFAAGNDGSGSNTVSTPGTAKNVITVGAGENVRQTGTDGCGVGNTGADSANDIIAFSSRGPINNAGGDGRISPNIMGPGTHIEAGIPQSNYNGSSVCNQFFPAGQTLYGWSSGTSHSCPAIAGGAALVYQDFLNNSLAAPSPAMVKAYLMNSATHMTGVGANDTLPSNNQGMGRMNLGRAFDDVARVMSDQATTFGATGETSTTTGSVSTTSQPFRVTLAWSDAPGPTTGAPYVNNLDLEVTVGGVTYRGNVFSGANSVSGGVADIRNNVESVFVPAGVSGSFTVTVRATNIAGDGVPGNADTTDQDFALVIYNGTAGAPPTDPVIGVSPSSFSFSGTAGGANPANQVLNISNTGGGTLNWTASDDAPWLTLSATSGTAPSAVTLSVSTAGLAAGTYNGTITITATGATNSPVSVPVTLTVNPVTVELLVNGGIEVSASPWVLSGLFVRSTGATPHSGAGFLSAGSSVTGSGAAFQQITIPAGPARNLTFWLNVTSSETTTTTQFDRLFIEVRSTGGTLLGTLATFSNLNKVPTTGAYTLRGPFSLAAWAGQTVRIQFRATTDVSLLTTFRVDDASVQ